MWPKWFPSSGIATPIMLWLVCMTWSVSAEECNSDTESFIMDLVYFHIHEWGYILLVLFLHSAKPSPSLTCVDFGTVFAGDLVHYPWTLLSCPFLLGVYQHSLDGLVLSHDGHDPVMVEHSTKYLQQTLNIWDCDQNSGPHLFDDIFLLFLGFYKGRHGMEKWGPLHNQGTGL